VGDDGAESVLGLGAVGARANFAPQLCAITPASDFAICDAFTEPAQRVVVGVPASGSGAPITLVSPGNPVSYRNGEGDVVNDTVLETGRAISAVDGAGVVDAVLVGASQAHIDFTFDDDMLLGRRASLVAGTPAPGLDAGITLLGVEGVAFGRGGGANLRGFRGILSEPLPGFSEAALFLTDPSYAPVLVLRSGEPVPNLPDAFVDISDVPIMGPQGAALACFLVDSEGERRAAIGFVDYETLTFRALVVAGQPAPGGGVFRDLGMSLAFTDAGDLIFSSNLEGNGSAYYVVSPTGEDAVPRRLFGTGDALPLPGGGSGVISQLASIPQGEPSGPSAVAGTRFTAAALLDQIGYAILLVDLGA
jgi:hypothetical protein